MKKLLSEGNTEKANENEVTSYLGEDESLLNDTEQSSCESAMTKTGFAAKAKDNIILRTLLNTSDLEPQFLKLDSIFDLNSPIANSNPKKEELLCETQNQPCQLNKFVPRNTKKAAADSLRSEQSEQRYKRKKNKKEEPDQDDEFKTTTTSLEMNSTDKIKKPNKNKRNVNRGMSVSKSNQNVTSGKKNKTDDMHLAFSQKNPYESNMKPKVDKLNNSNYLNKENDSTNPIGDLFQCQSYSNQWDSPSYNKKIKIDTTSQQESSSFYQSPQIHINKSQRNKEEITFPSSLTSSTISVSSSSSLSSPGNNNMISFSSNLNGKLYRHLQ